jgi:hypothetical protein
MRFSAGNVSTLATATANAPLVAIRAPATERCAIREIKITLVAATSTLLGITRATTVSVTPGTTMAGVNSIPGAPASGTLLVSSWATAPVVAATAYIDQIVLPAAIGAGYVLTWPADDPLVVGLGSAIAEIVITNLVAVAPSLFRYTVRWEN